MAAIEFSAEHPLPDEIKKKIDAAVTPALDFMRQTLPREGVIKKNVTLVLDGEVYVDNYLGTASFEGCFTIEHDEVLKMHVPLRGDSTRD